MQSRDMVIIFRINEAIISKKRKEKHYDYIKVDIKNSNIASKVFLKTCWIGIIIFRYIIGNTRDSIHCFLAICNYWMSNVRDNNCCICSIFSS
jgi:hypothetical protein